MGRRRRRKKRGAGVLGEGQSTVINWGRTGKWASRVEQ